MYSQVSSTFCGVSSSKGVFGVSVVVFPFTGEIGLLMLIGNMADELEGVVTLELELSLDSLRLFLRERCLGRLEK